jgi:hypothetical protein
MPALLPAGIDRLPPLGGRLFAVYRLAWWAFAAAGVLTVATPLVDPRAAIGISLARSAKAVVLIAVSAILYHRRRKDPVAAMLALAFLLWTISSSVDFVASSALPALIDRLRFLLFALALLLFPDGEWRPRWTPYVGLAIVSTFLLGVAEGSGLLPTRLFLPIAIGCVLASLVALLSRYRSLDPGIQKQQLKWVVLGLVSGIGLILSARAGAALTRDMAVPLFGSILLEGLFQLGIVIVALGFLTSLLRYRLYDAEAAISRSAVYAGLTLALVGTFAGSEALIELVGQRLFGMAIGNISGAVAAALAAMMLTPLHGRISNWAERHFQHDLVILKTELPDLLAVLSASASVNRLVGAVLPRIEAAVHATRIALVVDGRIAGTQGIGRASARKLLSGWKPPEDIGLLERDEGAAFPLCVPLRCPLGSIRAWLLLGPRPDGSFYGQDDLEALSQIAPPLQRALLSVAERQADDRERRRIDSEMRHALRALTERVAALEPARPSISAVAGECHA